jgi:hypothetical protein
LSRLSKTEGYAQKITATRFFAEQKTAAARSALPNGKLFFEKKPLHCFLCARSAKQCHVFFERMAFKKEKRESKDFDKTKVFLKKASKKTFGFLN